MFLNKFMKRSAGHPELADKNNLAIKNTQNFKGNPQEKAPGRKTQKNIAKEIEKDIQTQAHCSGDQENRSFATDVPDK